MPYTCPCETPIQDFWHYCPRCGRSCGFVEIQDRPLTFRIAPGQPRERSIHLLNRGHRPVPFRIAIQGSHALQLAGDSAGEIAEGAQAVLIRVDRVPGEGQLPMLELVTRDGPRDPDDLWEPPSERRHPLEPIKVEEVAPPRLEVRPELAILTDARPSRPLHLLNTGVETLQVKLPELPVGVSYTLPGHQPHATLCVPPGAPVEVPVAITGPARDSVSPLSFQADTGKTTGIRLARHTAATPTVLPEYVVGVDFGTRNSSVIVRRVGRWAGVPDQIVAVRENGAARFPSALHLGSDGQWRFGTAAIARWQEEGGGSRDLIRNLKTLLSEHQEQVEVGGRPYPVRGLIARFLAHIRDAADDLIGSWGDSLAEAQVTFVFSLPVLDGGEEHKALHQAVREIAAEVFAACGSHLEFVPEPVCAALYIIQQINQGSLPLPLATGSRIVVFDSGGGTTDLVLGVVEMEEGRIGLRLTCDPIGLDREGFIFGGNEVNRKLALEVLGNRPWLLPYRLAQHSSYSSLAPEVRENDLSEKMEPLKLAAVNGDPNGSSLDLLGEDLWTAANGFEVLPLELRHVTADHVADAAGELVAMVSDEVRREWFTDAGIDPNSEVDYVVLVGGNSRIPRVQEEVRQLFNVSTGRAQLVLLDEQGTMEAVARGTVLLPDARLDNMLPYFLTVSILQPGQPPFPLWTKAANTALVPGKSKRVPRVFGYADIVVRLETGIGEEVVVLEERTIARPTPDARSCVLQAALESTSGGLELEVRYGADPSGQQQPTQVLFTYPV